MTRRVITSLFLIFAVLTLSYASSPGVRGPEGQVTGTAFDTAPPPEVLCQPSIDEALERQLGSLNADLLAALRSCPSFTAEDWKQLHETEKGKTTREVYFLRRVGLTKLARRAKR